VLYCTPLQGHHPSFQINYSATRFVECIAGIHICVCISRIMLHFLVATNSSSTANCVGTPLDTSVPKSKSTLCRCQPSKQPHEETTSASKLLTLIALFLKLITGTWHYPLNARGGVPGREGWLPYETNFCFFSAGFRI